MCLCGDTQCPSCGTAQGTYVPAWFESLQVQAEALVAYLESNDCGVPAAQAARMIDDLTETFQLDR